MEFSCERFTVIVCCNFTQRKEFLLRVDTLIPPLQPLKQAQAGSGFNYFSRSTFTCPSTAAPFAFFAPFCGKRNPQRGVRAIETGALPIFLFPFSPAVLD